MKYTNWKARIQALIDKELLHPSTLDAFITEIEQQGDDAMLTINAFDLSECDDYGDFISSLRDYDGWLRINQEDYFPNYQGSYDQFIYAIKNCSDIDYYAEDSNGDYLVFDSWRAVVDWAKDTFHFYDDETNEADLRKFLQNDDTNIDEDDLVAEIFYDEE